MRKIYLECSVRSSSPSTVESKTLKRLECWLARRVFFLYETLEDIMEERKRLKNRARAYGENEEPLQSTPYPIDSSLGSSLISFNLLGKRRRQEERQLKKDIKHYGEACPLYEYCTNHLGLGVKFWAFLISRCSPFKFNTLGKIIAYLGEHDYKGKKYKNNDGKELVKYRWCMRMRKQEPYHGRVKELIPQLEKKNPTFTESHLKNLAWYKIFFEEIIIPYYKKAKVTCLRCHNRAL